MPGMRRFLLAGAVLAGCLVAAPAQAYCEPEGECYPTDCMPYSPGNEIRQVLDAARSGDPQAVVRALGACS